MVTTPHRLCDFEFDRAAIARAAAENRLLSMEIEFSLRCNFRCPYCYVPADSYFEGELTIKGPCNSCDMTDGCYGCRGAAYQLTGDYLASDPLCRRRQHN